jgi:PBSX family phage terminase large subunit
LEFVPHGEKQERAIFSEKPIVVLGTGIQFGKTTVGAIKMKMAIHQFTDPSDNFLITAPTYKILQQSTLPAFLRVMDGCGEYSKVDAVFRTNWGTHVYCRTATDPDSIVGITNIRFVWGDEAGLYGLYFWENIQARAAFREAPITLTTSPYTLNWIYKEFIRPKQKDASARPDCELVQAASWENPYMPRGVIERSRIAMDPRRFNALFGGQWVRMAGLVYDCFDEQENICDSIPIPSGSRVVAGVDWGYTHPFVVVVRAITPNGTHLQVAEHFQTELTIDKKVEIAQRLKAVFGISMFYCDPARPDDIASFCAAKLPAVGANNDIRSGIDRHYELIKTRRYKIFRGTSPHTEDETELYHYPSPEDLGPDKDDKEELPVDKDNHTMDANRYVSIETYRQEAKRAPFVPGEGLRQEDQFQRLERLKTGARRMRNTEEWG